MKTQKAKLSTRVLSAPNRPLRFYCSSWSLRIAPLCFLFALSHTQTWIYFNWLYFFESNCAASVDHFLLLETGAAISVLVASIDFDFKSNTRILPTFSYHKLRFTISSSSKYRFWNVNDQYEYRWCTLIQFHSSDWTGSAEPKAVHLYPEARNLPVDVIVMANTQYPMKSVYAGSMCWLTLGPERIHLHHHHGNKNR